MTGNNVKPQQRAAAVRVACVAALVVMLGAVAAFGAGCGGPSTTFTIISGSENESLEPLLKDYGRSIGVNVEMRYLGSVDIMLELAQDEPFFDAVWPASSIWVTMGDKNRLVKNLRSVMTSPVVFGIRKSLAEELGFVGRDVRVADILNAIQERKLSFMMTSASQSNSGASAYLGFLYALAGSPDILTTDDLHRPEVKTDMRELLAGINRSSGSSGWLKDLFLEGDYDAMVNYEALIIEANQVLTAQGKEPLYAIYPVDGLAIADSPFGYVNKGDLAKEEVFAKLQEFLLSDKAQAEMLARGRRVGLGGVLPQTDPAVFNPAWGIDVRRVLSPITYPAADVIAEALNLYQTTFRKPALTAFCLDYSGSMRGDGENQLKSAMALLLDPNQAAQYLLQPGPDDISLVIPFSGGILAEWSVTGNDPTQLAELLGAVQKLVPEGNTDIYSPAIRALGYMETLDLDAYQPAIIVMTDGQSNTGASFGDLERSWMALGEDIPIFSIMFGEADESQLEPMAELTRARVFDGRKDLVAAFRQVKGYNY